MSSSATAGVRSPGRRRSASSSPFVPVAPRSLRAFNTLAAFVAATWAATAPAARAQGKGDAIDYAALDANVVALDQLTVTETRDTFAPASAAAAASALTKVAGAVELVDSADVERGRVATGADILAFTPGVFAAPPAGSGDGIKLSIRGSAIARSAGNFFRSGTLFTFDGLPVTGPGGTPYELFETYGLAYTEVLIGGNAFDVGALQLGGAINYVTKTGYDAAPFEVRLEAGSYDFRKYQVSAGRVFGKADYFLSASALETDGYQPNSRGTAQGFAGNFGYRLTPTIATRFFLRYRTTENETPGNLTLNQLQADSSQANLDNLVGRVNRVQPGSTWIANRTEFTLTPDARLTLGFVFHDAPIDIAPNASPGTATNPLADRERSIWNFRDVTVSGRFDVKHTLLGLASESTAALVVSEEYFADVTIYANNPNVVTGPRAFRTLLKTANYDGSNDSSLRLANRLQLTPALALHTGVALAYLKRAGEITSYHPALPPLAPAPGAAGRDFSRDNLYLAPRVGLTYEFTPAWTVFGNVTRSVEAPNSWQLSRGSTGNYPYHDPIRDQKAWAYELGTRARHGAFTGSLSLFHTDVTDELLSIPLVPGNPAAGSITYNGTDTYKQGVELALDATLWSEGGWLRTAPRAGGTRLVLGQSYSYNDFGYKGDPTFGENELPGVPRQYYQARLSFEHASGFYVTATALHASAYYVDFANTLETPSYTLHGLSAGYTHPTRGWQLFVDARNLTDEAYASSAGPAFLAGTTDVARRTNPLFQAGDGFNVTAGVTLKF